MCSTSGEDGTRRDAVNTVENWNIGGGTCINVKELKVRNSIIVQAYKEGYSQQMIAKVLEITQQAVFAVIKRSRK